MHECWPWYWLYHSSDHQQFSWVFIKTHNEGTRGAGKLLSGLTKINLKNLENYFTYDFPFAESFLKKDRESQFLEDIQGQEVNSWARVTNSFALVCETKLHLVSWHVRLISKWSSSSHPLSLSYRGWEI